MSAPEYNIKKLEALESRLAVLSGAARGVADEANEATEDARREAERARRLSLFHAAFVVPLSDLLAQHRQELERLGSVEWRDERHARNVHQCRTAVDALRSAVKAAERAQALRNEASAAAALATPLRELVKRCRAWAGLEGGYFPIGRSEGSQQ